MAELNDLIINSRKQSYPQFVQLMQFDDIFKLLEEANVVEFKSPPVFLKNGKFLEEIFNTYLSQENCEKVKKMVCSQVDRDKMSIYGFSILAAPKTEYFFDDLIGKIQQRFEESLFKKYNFSEEAKRRITQVVISMGVINHLVIENNRDVVLSR